MIGGRQGSSDCCRMGTHLIAGPIHPNTKGEITVSAWLRSSRPGRPAESWDWEKEVELHDGGVVVCQQGGYLELSVSDTGAGLSAEQLEQLFTAGVQFDANKLQNGGGSGIGLCLSKVSFSRLKNCNQAFQK